MRIAISFFVTKSSSFQKKWLLVSARKSTFYMRHSAHVIMPNKGTKCVNKGLIETSIKSSSTTCIYKFNTLTNFIFIENNISGFIDYICNPTYGRNKIIKKIKLVLQ